MVPSLVRGNVDLPQDILAEKSFLGCLLMDWRCYDDIVEVGLTPRDFYHPQYRLVYESIVGLLAQKKPADYVTVVSWLKASGKIDVLNGEGRSGADFILGIREDQASSVNIEHYAQIIKDKAVMRDIISAARKIVETGLSHTGQCEEFISQAESSILGISKSVGHKGLRPLSELFLNVVDSLRNRGNDLPGIKTGLRDLDQKLLGFQPGQLIIAAGRPGMGKTAFGISIAANISKESQKAVAIFSLEMLSLEIVNRLLSKEMQIKGENLKTKTLSKEEMNKISMFTSKLSQMPIFVNDKSNITVWDILSDCRKLKRDMDLGLIMVDYIQLMRPHIKSPSREQQISEISRELKQLAKELECPVLGLSQLNRSVEARVDKRPNVSDLRESGALEQDADVVLLLYRDDFYNPESKDKGVAEIIIGKNRSGETGTVKVSWLGSFAAFENISMGREIEL